MKINVVYNWLKNVRKIACPGFCLLCGKATEKPVCDECAVDLPYLAKHCSRCALPMDDADTNGLVCGECLVDPPDFNRVLAPFRYADPVDQMIGRFKYQHSLPMGRVLGEYLAQYVVQHTQSVDLLIPVPLHASRLRQRGFNQSAELAQYLSRRINVPWRVDGVARVQAGDEQRGANRKQRQKQVRRVFEVRANNLPKRVALIDDVVTTGATARVIARLLRRAGVEYIEVWAIARTPKP